MRLGARLGSQRACSPNWPLQCAQRVFPVITGVLRVMVYVFKLHNLNQYTCFPTAVEVLSDLMEDFFTFVQVAHYTFLHHVLYLFHDSQDATQQLGQQWAT